MQAETGEPTQSPRWCSRRQIWPPDRTGRFDPLQLALVVNARRAHSVSAFAQRPRGKFPPVVIGDPEAPATHLPPQDPILLDQVRQHLPLRRSSQMVTVSSNIRKAEISITGGSLYHSRNRPLPTRSAHTWNTTRRRRPAAYDARPISGMARARRASEARPRAALRTLPTLCRRGKGLSIG